MISGQVQLTQPLKGDRQFIATSGTEHHLLLDDAAGGTGPTPIELVAVGLAGCTAFDVITILRHKFHQKVTGYQVRVEADQAERPPQVFTAVRIHHVVIGLEIDPSAIEEAIRLSEEKYCSVGAMVKHAAPFKTTYEIVEEKTAWFVQTPAASSGLGCRTSHQKGKDVIVLADGCTSERKDLEKPQRKPSSKAWR